LTSFAVTINNHFVAAAAIMVSAAGYLRIEREREGDPHTAHVPATHCLSTPPHARPTDFIVTGLAAAFAVTNELPALSYFVLLAAALLWHSARPTLTWFVPAAAGILLLALGTNYLAHQTWSPPYMHRAEGGDWSSGNWYVYPGSYWSSDKKSTIDQGEQSIGIYAFHVLVGHHGIITLTPVWLLLFLALTRWPSAREQRRLAIITVIVTLVCLGFYLFRPAGDRNYGGRSVAFRWALWLAPLWWLLLIDPVARCLSSRPGRIVAWLLLLASIASAAYGWLLPWKHPWSYELWVGS
jgi:hypothetical protein